MSGPASASDSLDIAERRRRIVTRVRAEQFMSVQALAREFSVTPVTVRADIDALAREHDEFRRVRGGIMRVRSPYKETAYEERSAAAAHHKRLIGVAAAAAIENYDTLFLDVGTTAMAVAEALTQREGLRQVTVFTNGLNIAMALESAWPNIQTVVTGGSLRPLQHSLVEPMAGLMLRQIQIGRAFIGCNGVEAEFGVSATNLPEADVKRMAMEAALETVIVADASKFGRRTLARICGLGDVDKYLTAGEIAPETRKAIRAAGARLIDAGAA